jgi:hypothetical protein
MFSAIKFRFNLFRFTAPYKVKSWFLTMRYRFIHWLFYWVVDSGGDIGLRIAGIVTLVKYKEHTVFYWFKHFERAPKYVNIDSGRS